LSLKETWLSLTEEQKIPYKKKQSDHLAKQGQMQEAIVDALQKTKGGNCVRSYASLSKVNM
jgi:hypothetical protein